MSDKPTAAVQSTIDDMKKDLMYPGAMPEKSAASEDALNEIHAALWNTKSGLQALREAGQDEFPQNKTLYYDSDLESVPFLVRSQPVFSSRLSTIPGQENLPQDYVGFDAWILDAENPLLAPIPVDVLLTGRYLLNQARGLDYQGLQGRVWTVKRNEKMKKTSWGYPRMLALWEAPEGSTF